MENNEIKMLTEINKKVQNLISDFNSLVNDISVLSQMVYDREIQKCDDEIDIKLRSHM